MQQEIKINMQFSISQGSETHSLQNSLFRQEPVTYCRPEPTYRRPEPLCVVADIP